MSSRSPEQTPSWVTVAILAQGTSRAVAVTQAFLAKCCGAGSHHSVSSSRGKQGRPQETKEKPRRDLKHVARAMRPNLGCSDNRFHKQGLSKAHQCQRLCPYGWSDKPYRRVATDVWPHVSIFLPLRTPAPPPAPFWTPFKHSVCHLRPLGRERTTAVAGRRRNGRPSNMGTTYGSR